MLGKTNAGGGSAALNFKVVGGTTAPASPSENTIWVNTSTPITGWVFSSAEPESPSDGLVWMRTGFSSNVAFSAVKRETVMVYPKECKQLVAGGWAKKETLSYQGGEWKRWATWYFESGVGQIVSWTGWNMFNAEPTIVDNPAKMTLESTRGTYESRAAYLSSMIDMTDLSTVYFDIECPSGSLENVWCGITPSDPTGENPFSGGIVVNPTQSSRYTLAVDVSAFAGNARPVIYANKVGLTYVYNVYAD